MEKSSAETIFNSNTPVLQPDDGYRFSIDPVILAAHVKARRGAKLIDVGTGCGIIPLILASRNPELMITGIEIQEELFRFAKRNIRTHCMERQARIIHGDIADINREEINGPVDIIVSNPPYKKKGSGRLNPNPQKAIARHEIHLDIDLLFACSEKLLKKTGEIYLIFPAERIAELFSSMAHHNFGARFLRYIHTNDKTPARRVILCAVKGGKKPCTIYPPMFTHTPDHQYSAQYHAIFSSHPWSTE